MVRFNRLKTWLGSLGILLATLVFCCLFTPLDAFAEETTSPAAKAPKLLVMPFKDLFEVYGKESSYVCPFTGKIHMLGAVNATADGFLTEQLLILIEKQSIVPAFLANRATGLIAEHLLGRTRISSEIEFLVDIGAEYGADIVMAGYLYRFEERIGSNYAAESPASVAFSLFLIDVHTGHLVWVRHFDETQKPLSDNLFKLSDFIKKKGRWVSARELALTGLDEMVLTLPKSLTNK
jgi:TolB-like protein